MPRAGDPYLDGSSLPVTHDPLDRLSFQPPDTSLDIEELLDMWRQWFLDIGLPIIEELTGIDLTTLLPLLSVISDPAALMQFLLTAGPAVAASLLDMIGSYLGIPNLGKVIQQLALLPSILLSAATGQSPSGDGDDTILQELFDALRGLFGGGTPGDDPSDVTPPTAPNLTLNSASYSTVTVTASGAVDP